MEAGAAIEAIILCLIIVVAVVGNLSLWIIICKSPELRTVTNSFILGLAVADLLVSVLNVPLTISALVAGKWPYSESACTVLGFFNMLFLVTSVMSLCNISINRYFMICQPFKFKDIYIRRNAVYMIIGVITLSVLLSSPPLFGWGQYSYIAVQSFCFCDWSKNLSYAIFMIVCCFGGPFSVMSVCNICIFKTVRASRRRIARMSTIPVSSLTDRDSGISSIESSTGKDFLSKKDPSRRKSSSEITEQRLAISLIVVVIVFVICWLPYCVSMLLLIAVNDSVPRGFHVFTITLGYANSCCNPIIYGLMNNQFAKGFRNLYCWWKK